MERDEAKVCSQGRGEDQLMVSHQAFMFIAERELQAKQSFIMQGTALKCRQESIAGRVCPTIDSLEDHGPALNSLCC